MPIKDHALYQLTISQVGVWLPLASRILPIMRVKLQDRSLSPMKRYEIGSFYWCETFDGVFNRLKAIREMTGRSIYKRKEEASGELKKNWMTYNYQIYITIYQSILDVALLMTNEIL